MQLLFLGEYMKRLISYKFISIYKDKNMLQICKYTRIKHSNSNINDKRALVSVCKYTKTTYFI